MEEGEGGDGCGLAAGESSEAVVVCWKEVERVLEA